MKFIEFKEILRKNFDEMTKDVTHLFEVEVDKDEMWSMYLESFNPKYNKIFRERREHDCSCCRQFIKNIGNAVVIKNNKITTIWDFITENGDDEYQPVINAMSEYIKSKAVSGVYLTKERHIGTDSNLEKTEEQIYTWNHLYLELPNKFVYRGSDTLGTQKGNLTAVRNVFKRSLDEITEDSVLTVLELITSNTLYKGNEWQRQLQEFLKHKKTYVKLSAQEKELYAWEQSVIVGAVIGKIKNHSIGTLLINISEEMDLNLAVKKYEQIVAPSNYKRPKAIYTKKMLEEAKVKITEMGYLDSLSRRFAILDDITANNILHVNRDCVSKIKGDIFDEMMEDVVVNPKQFSRVEEISADKFIKDVLPTAKELEVFLENKHSGNMVSLIAPENKDSKTMFKWDNNFSWGYAGNITDSSMKDNVKSAGGRVDGDLRFSIQWNDIESDQSDLDAHCIEPNGFEIEFTNKGRLSPRNKGMLDVDIVSPKSNVPAVENITYANRNTMQDGVYKFFVHQYSGSVKRGFRAEVEFDGQIFEFNYDKSMRNGEKIYVAEVTLRNGEFSVKESLPSTTSSRDLWELKTNNFVPVSIAMFSPNYWNEQDGIGNKHVFFMLKDCVNPETPNGFYNEFLRQDLVTHKRVFEALGSKMRVKEVEEQLSGVGFSLTRRNELVVKVKGQTERIMKVKF